MKTIKQQLFTGERALYASEDLTLEYCTFDDGESPLKESADISLVGCMFKWKYPLWYCLNIQAKDCAWFEMARAGVWYTTDITVSDCVIEAPKNFRRCTGVTLENVSFSNAAETLWSCSGVKLRNVTATGHYFAMNSDGIEAENLTLYGNYSFDGAKNVTVRNSKLLSKDSFWNCENVTVYDSYISGEYLAWNSSNVTLVNCTIESLQGMCYVNNLKMIDCRLINTTLAFEYSSVEARISSAIDSVLNPGRGTIQAESIGELIVETDRVDPGKIKIICDEIGKRSERPEWLRDK